MLQIIKTFQRRHVRNTFCENLFKVIPEISRYKKPSAWSVLWLLKGNRPAIILNTRTAKNKARRKPSAVIFEQTEASHSVYRRCAHSIFLVDKKSEGVKRKGQRETKVAYCARGERSFARGQCGRRYRRGAIYAAAISGRPRGFYGLFVRLRPQPLACEKLRRVKIRYNVRTTVAGEPRGESDAPPLPPGATAASARPFRRSRGEPHGHVTRVYPRCYMAF